MKIVIPTRRQWLQAAALWPAIPGLVGASRRFWETKDPAQWTADEKQLLLTDSPWAQGGFARMIEEKRRPTPGYGAYGKTGPDMPDPRSGGLPPGGAKSVPIGEKPPPVPKPDTGEPLQFPVLARWETARPVRLAGGPETPELTGQFYVIRLRGLPLMPPPKVKPGEAAPPDPNEHLLPAIKQGARLERKDKSDIPCDHLFTGSGNTATEVLLFFPRGESPITLADKTVTLDVRFSVFHLTVKFPLKDMVYKGALAL